jgi:hypothetical protein
MKASTTLRFFMAVLKANVVMLVVDERLIAPTAGFLRGQGGAECWTERTVKSFEFASQCHPNPED